MNDDDIQRRWSIGRLAEASGVTVRALHYYDEIGLVSASERTRAGHRRYTDADVRRLYRVRALRQLGLSLDEVGTALGRTTDDLTTLRKLLDSQLADLETRASQIATQTRQVRRLLGQLSRSDMPDPEEFLAALETTVPLTRAEAYFSDRQRAALTQRATELGEEAIDDLKSEWLTLVAKLHEYAKDGTPADDPGVQALVTRWQEIGATFHTGDSRLDEQMTAAATARWRHGGTALARQVTERVSGRLGGLDADDVARVVRNVEHARHVAGSDITEGPPSFARSIPATRTSATSNRCGRSSATRAWWRSARAPTGSTSSTSCGTG
ncbi:MerR family transcriptional regulator [Actinopolymorpha sp. B11F2]|uniref:MerR family transcriptional regulator n=1 Tax=Actinopolymorpha sp. B11F2 TaxID=3160862 RepID=UPI0032E40844